MKIGYNHCSVDVGGVIATKWRHFPFYLKPYFFALGVFFQTRSRKLVPPPRRLLLHGNRGQKSKPTVAKKILKTDSSLSRSMWTEQIVMNKFRIYPCFVMPQ